MTRALDPASVTEKAKARAEPAWLADARREALRSYETLDLPKWSRTDLSKTDVPGLALRAAQAPPATARRVKAEGVVHMPLLQAAREHEDLVRPHLVAPIPGDDKWARLHAALWSQGDLLYLEKGKELDEPIPLDVTYDATGAVRRDVVRLSPRAKAHAVVRTRGGAPDALVMERLELFVDEGANLQLATLQDAARGQTVLANRPAQLDRDARLSWVDGQFGGGRAVTNNDVTLAAPGAELAYVGAFFGSAGQHHDITTAAHHKAPHTTSQLDMKGALNETGYAVNYSIVDIQHGASNSSGHQHQETLLLSEKARADAIPKLDVENNDVSASHGATVGQVDEDQLFYLRTRGFREPDAVRLIVEGFFEPLLGRIPVENVREEVRAAILARMRG